MFYGIPNIHLILVTVLYLLIIILVIYQQTTVLIGHEPAKDAEEDIFKTLDVKDSSNIEHWSSDEMIIHFAKS